MRAMSLCLAIGLFSASCTNACPPNPAYQLKKMLRRNKGPFLGAALMLLALLLGKVRMASPFAESERLALLEAQGKTQLALDTATFANEQVLTRLTQIEKGYSIVVSIFDELGLNEAKDGTMKLEDILAKRLVEAAQQLEGESFGNTLDVAWLQLKLGKTLISVGYSEDAVVLIQKANETMSILLGADHPATLTSMNNLAMSYKAANKLDQAIRLGEKTLMLTRTKLGDDHPDTLRSIFNLAASYGQDKQFDKAELLYREIVASVKKKSIIDSPIYAHALVAFGAILMDQNKWIDAEPFIREALVLREKNEPDDWRTFNAQSLLGGTLLGQQKLAEAEPLLLKGYEGLKQRESTIPPQGNTRIPEALDRLIDLYMIKENPDEAKKWQAERAYTS